MTERPDAAGPRRAGGPPLRIPAAVLCVAAGLSWSGLAQAAVPRERPEEIRLNTASQPQTVVFLYAPKPPATARPSAAPVIFFSGEFGWVPVLQDAASSIASTGRIVLGVDSMEYFGNPVSGGDRAADLAKFRALVNGRAGRPKDADVILAGFLFGASSIPYMLNEPGVGGVRGAVLLSPRSSGAKVFRVGVQLKMDPPPGERVDVEQEIRRMPPLPLVFMEGTLDKDSAARDLDAAARGPHKLVEVEGGDRQFHDVRDGLFTILNDALQWIDGAAAPAAQGTPAPQASATPRPSPAPGTPRAAPPRD